MDSATQKKAVEAIMSASDAIFAKGELPTFDVMFDAMQRAGLQLIDTRTHWAAPNEPTKDLWCAFFTPEGATAITPRYVAGWRAMRDAAK